MAGRPRNTDDLAARVWRAMFAVLMKSAPQRTASLGKRGLTPNDARALGSIETDAGKPMRALAEAWECDPSYATWIVDRLEKLGLAERQADPNDRRVKLVALTKKGLRTRTQLLDDFHRPPPELAALDREDLEALDRILTKLAPTTKT